MNVDRCEKEKLLRKVQQLYFQMTEAALFLDNQPGCFEALASYENFRCQYLKAKEVYENVYGPLNYAGVNTERDGWSWVKGPWPWEGEK